MAKTTAVSEEHSLEPLQSDYEPAGSTKPILIGHAEPFHQLRHILNFWWLEIFCAVLGTILLIALALILNAFDGKAVPHFGSAFGSALTLNTIIAILATTAKTCLLFPVAECISQLKWIWFSSRLRRLSDLALFDRASRGLLGCIELLWATRLQYVGIRAELLCQRQESNADDVLL